MPQTLLTLFSLPVQPPSSPTHLPGKSFLLTFSGSIWTSYLSKHFSALFPPPLSFSPIIPTNTHEIHIISYMEWVASPGSMHDTGCLGLVHWDDPEGWYGEGGGFRMGNTCIPVVDSFWYLAKPIQYCKVVPGSVNFSETEELKLHVMTLKKNKNKIN